MTTLPQLHPQRRGTRVRLTEATPAVLRFQDGRRATGRLRVVSASGGLLSLPKPLDRGAIVRLMFVTQTGPVLGAAELLAPVSKTEQPFRFIGMCDEEQRKLGSVIEGCFTPAAGPEEVWIDKYRNALEQGEPPRRRLFAWALTALTLGILGLGSVFLALHRLR
jgi:hypothetical protein